MTDLSTAGIVAGATGHPAAHVEERAAINLINSKLGLIPDWQPSTAYPDNFVVVYTGLLYRTTTAFTTGSSFDDTNLELLTGLGNTVTLVWDGSAYPARPSGLAAGLAVYVGPAANTPTDPLAGDAWRKY